MTIAISVQTGAYDWAPVPAFTIAVYGLAGPQAPIHLQEYAR